MLDVDPIIMRHPLGITGHIGNHRGWRAAFAYGRRDDVHQSWIEWLVWGAT